MKIQLLFAVSSLIALSYSLGLSQTSDAGHPTAPGDAPEQAKVTWNGDQPQGDVGLLHVVFGHAGKGKSHIEVTGTRSDLLGMPGMPGVAALHGYGEKETMTFEFIPREGAAKLKGALLGGLNSAMGGKSLGSSHAINGSLVVTFLGQQMNNFAFGRGSLHTHMIERAARAIVAVAESAGRERPNFKFDIGAFQSVAGLTQ